jgi:hypothetical protein
VSGSTWSRSASACSSCTGAPPSPRCPSPACGGSPRQIVEHVRAQQPSPALAELTDFVEEVYFSPRLALETVLPQASERVDRAVRERART